MQEIIRKYEEEADKVGPRKLGGFTLTENNAKDFIRNFLFKHNKVCTTENLSGAVICWQNKRRSPQDIYCIAKNYFPEVTFEEVIDILVDLLFENNKDSEAILYGSYCSDIHKTVFQTWGIKEYSYQRWIDNGHVKRQFFQDGYNQNDGLNPVFLNKIKQRKNANS
jgi:hypothetical protein